jgi:hypothetical protein
MEIRAREKHNRAVARVQKARIHALHMCIEIMKKDEYAKSDLAVWYNEYKHQCSIESDLTKCTIRNPKIEKQVRELFKK